MAGTSKGEGAEQDDEARTGGSGEDPGIPASASSPIGDTDVDARWASIVKHLGDVERAAGSGPAPAGAPGPATPGHVVARTPGPRDWPVTPEVEALEEAESHFAPPDPGPVITSRDPLATLAWAGAVGVPVLGVLALILRSLLPALRLPGWAGPLAAVLFVASVAVLAWRMPARRDPGDRDDGAVV